MDVDELVEQTGIPKKTMGFLQKKYGSLEEFKKIYIKALLNGKVEELGLPKVLDKRLIQYYDLSEPDVISRKDTSFHVDIYSEQLKQGKIVFRSTAGIEFLQEVPKLTEKQSIAIRLYYGIECEKLANKSEVGKKLGITREGARKTIESGIKRIQNSDVFKNNIIECNVKKIPLKYLMNTVFGITENLELHMNEQLLYNIYCSKIENFEVEKEYFIQQVSEFEKEIQSLSIESEKKDKLLVMLGDRKQKIIQEIKLQMPTLEISKEDIEKSIALIGNLDVPIEEIGFDDDDIYICRALKRNGVFTIKQLLEVSISELEVCRGIGRKSIDTIKQKLIKIGCDIPKDKNVPLCTGLSKEKIRDEIIFNLDMEQSEKDSLLRKLDEVTISFEQKGIEKKPVEKEKTDEVLLGTIEDLKNVYKELESSIQELDDLIRRRKQELKEFKVSIPQIIILKKRRDSLLYRKKYIESHLSEIGEL